MVLTSIHPHPGARSVSSLKLAVTASERLTRPTESLSSSRYPPSNSGPGHEASEENKKVMVPVLLAEPGIPEPIRNLRQRPEDRCTASFDWGRGAAANGAP